MTHDPPTDDLATLSDTAFWANHHAAAAARDHRSRFTVVRQPFGIGVEPRGR